MNPDIERVDVDRFEFWLHFAALCLCGVVALAGTVFACLGRYPGAIVAVGALVAMAHGTNGYAHARSLVKAATATPSGVAHTLPHRQRIV